MYRTHLNTLLELWLGIWFKLHKDWAMLSIGFDFRMPQWQCKDLSRNFVTFRINNSSDLAVFNILPRERLERNARLIHMDKIFLVSVATSSHVTIPLVEIALVVCAICVVNMIESLLELSALGNEQTNSSDTTGRPSDPKVSEFLPPTLPHELAQLNGRGFASLLRTYGA